MISRFALALSTGPHSYQNSASTSIHNYSLWVGITIQAHISDLNTWATKKLLHRYWWNRTRPLLIQVFPCRAPLKPKSSYKLQVNGNIWPLSLIIVLSRLCTECRGDWFRASQAEFSAFFIWFAYYMSENDKFQALVSHSLVYVVLSRKQIL